MWGLTIASVPLVLTVDVSHEMPPRSAVWCSLHPVFAGGLSVLEVGIIDLIVLEPS